jgi:PAS domain S-box-containing protein
MALLDESDWDSHYDLTFSLWLERAECEYLTGQLASAEARLSWLSTRARTIVDSAAVTCVRLNLYTTLDHSDSAVEVGLDYLRRVDDGRWPLHATAEDVRQAYDRLLQRLGSGSIESLVDLPLMTDPDRRATMDVLTMLTSPALFTEENLFRLVVCRMAALSLEHGNSDGSCLAYAWLGSVLGMYFGDYQAGFRFGRLGLDLVERGLDRFRARVYLVFAVHVVNWTQNLSMSRDLLRRAFAAAQVTGDLSYVAYSCVDLVTNFLASGDPLGEVEREAENGLEFVRKMSFGLISDCMTGQLRLIRMLRGLRPAFTSFDGAEFDEGRFEQRLESKPQLAFAASWYWIRKLQACVYAGDYASAVSAASKAASVLWTTPTQFERAEYHFYAALARAAYCEIAAAEERPQHLEALASHLKQIAVWAHNGPATFANRAALVGAEFARLEQRVLDAERLYEQAIRSAREQGFVQNEGLAHEVAALFYAARGFDTFARAYLREARRCYLRWGASGKVRQLEQLHPHLRDAPAPASPTTTIGAPVERLDVGTVLKAAQAVSGEIVLGELIKTLLRIAIEHAGAERGLLILFSDDAPRIVAEATTGGGQVEVTLRETAMSPAELPESVLHTAIRTRESVILDDALAQNPFSGDEYLCQKRARSVLCLPLVKQAKLIGVLYLENNLASHVFTPARISVLELLASQAAISLENARLYTDLQEREARIRRLVDSNIIGITIWDLEGRIIDANQAFLDMVGYAREDLVSGRLRWRELTPAEWRDADEQIIAQLKAVGTLQPREKEYFRKDGSRVPVLVARALFEWKPDEGVSFVIDMTDRKRAEERLRASEQRFLDTQMELAHVTRITTLGELAASISHEVNQPLAAVVNAAAACLRWLDRSAPNLDEARLAVDWIIKEGNRATQVIRRVRALANKTSIEKVPLDINDVVREVIALVQSELISHQVSLRTEFAPALPLILGDRVQLQQVILNLAMNGIEAMQSITDRPRELVIRSLQDETQQVLVSVADCGVGISAENADRLFNAFFTTKSSGMGMGLSICLSIMEGHGGRLWATANVPHGATFQFVLPLHQEDAS